MAEAKPRGSAERSRRYRERKRAQGLRRVSMWVPDLRDPAVRARIRREVAALKDNADEEEAIRFIEQLTADMDWER